MADTKDILEDIRKSLDNLNKSIQNKTVLNPIGLAGALFLVLSYTQCNAACYDNRTEKMFDVDKAYFSDTNIVIDIKSAVRHEDGTVTLYLDDGTPLHISADQVEIYSSESKEAEELIRLQMKRNEEA